MPSEVFIEKTQPSYATPTGRKRASSFSINQLNTNLAQYNISQEPQIARRKSSLRHVSSFANLIRPSPSNATNSDDNNCVKPKLSAIHSRRQSLTRATVSSLAKVVPFAKEARRAMEEKDDDNTLRGTIRRRNSTITDIVTHPTPPTPTSTASKRQSKLEMINRRVRTLSVADIPTQRSTDYGFSWSTFGLLRSSSPSLESRRDAQVSPIDDKKKRKSLPQPFKTRSSAIRRNSLQSPQPIVVPRKKQSKGSISNTIPKKSEQTADSLILPPPIPQTGAPDDDAPRHPLATVNDLLGEPHTPLPQNRTINDLHTSSRRNSEPTVACTKHSKWLGNEGFMRRSKCEACNPALKKKKKADDKNRSLARSNSMTLVRRANSPPSNQEVPFGRLDYYYYNRKVRRISSEDEIMYSARSKVGRNAPSEAPRPGSCDISEDANLVGGLSGSTSSSSTSTTTRTAGSCSPPNATFDDSSMIDHCILGSPTSPIPTSHKTQTYLPFTTTAMPGNEDDSAIHTSFPNCTLYKAPAADNHTDPVVESPQQLDTFKRLMMCSEKLETLSRELFGLDNPGREPSADMNEQVLYQERIRECEKLVKSQRHMLDEAEQVLSVLAQPKTVTVSKDYHSFWQNSALQMRWQVSQWIGGGVGTGHIIGCESSVDGTYIMVVSGTSVTVEPQLLPKVSWLCENKTSGGDLNPVFRSICVRPI
ncbi:hypothetical protein DFQ30_001475 [Apophysomyces sp. BC1015]|nr:hypothetical protein DFQ30_001475 [Apophysomyces sp. BC1015]